MKYAYIIYLMHESGDANRERTHWQKQIDSIYSSASKQCNGMEAKRAELESQGFEHVRNLHSLPMGGELIIYQKGDVRVALMADKVEVQ